MNTNSGGNVSLVLCQAVVPHNTLPGQTFTVVVGNLIFPIVCPVNATAGSTISFHVPIHSFQPNFIQPPQFTSNTGYHDISNGDRRSLQFVRKEVYAINSSPDIETSEINTSYDTVSSNYAVRDIGIELSPTGLGNSADDNDSNNNIGSSNRAGAMSAKELDDTDDKDKPIVSTGNPSGSATSYSAVLSQEPTTQDGDEDGSVAAPDNMLANPDNTFRCHYTWFVSQMLSAIKNLYNPDPFDINSYGFKIKIPICLINIFLSSQYLDSARSFPTCCGSIDAMQIIIYIFYSIGISLGVLNLLFLLLVYKRQNCRFSIDKNCCGDIMRIHYIFQILTIVNALFVIQLRHVIQLLSAFSLFLTACGIIMSFLDYYKYFNLVRLRFSPNNHGTSLVPGQQDRYWDSTTVSQRCNVDNANKIFGYGIIVVLVIIQSLFMMYLTVMKNRGFSIEDQVYLPETYETKINGNGWTPISQFASFQNCSAYAGFTRSQSVEKSLGGGTVYEFCNKYNRSVDEFWYFDDDDGDDDDDDDDDDGDFKLPDDDDDFFLSNGNASACCCQWIYKPYDKWY